MRKDWPQTTHTMHAVPYADGTVLLYPTRAIARLGPEQKANLDRANAQGVQ